MLTNKYHIFAIFALGKCMSVLLYFIECKEFRYGKKIE